MTDRLIKNKEDWKNQRVYFKEMLNHIIGEMPEPPNEVNVDMFCSEKRHICKAVFEKLKLTCKRVFADKKIYTRIKYYRQLV